MRFRYPTVYVFMLAILVLGNQLTPSWAGPGATADVKRLFAETSGAYVLVADDGEKTMTPPAAHDADIIRSFTHSGEKNIREMAWSSLDLYTLHDHESSQDESVADAENEMMNRYPGIIANYLLSTGSDGKMEGAVDAIEDLIGKDMFTVETDRVRWQLLECAASKARLRALHDWISDHPVANSDSSAYSFTIASERHDAASFTNTSGQTLHNVEFSVVSMPNVPLIQSTEGGDNGDAAILYTMLGFSADTISSNYQLWDLIKLWHEQADGITVFVPEILPGYSVWFHYIASTSLIPYFSGVKLCFHADECSASDVWASNFEDVLNSP